MDNETKALLERLTAATERIAVALEKKHELETALGPGSWERGR